MAAVSQQSSLPADTVFGRWMHQSGWAGALVVLAFACTWALPLLASLVAGDVFAVEDRLGTWRHLVVAVRSPQRIFAAKVAASSVVILLLALGLLVSSVVGGLLAVGAHPLVGLTGQQIGPGRAFATLLYERTRGNPFFTEEMLKSLVDSGQLRREDGRWTGWDVTDFQLPRTVRDAIVARLERLSSAARTVVDIAAVLGTRASYAALEAVSGLAAPALVGALMEGLLGPLAPTYEDAGQAREAVQTATLLALRALGVVDARARGLVAQCVLP